MKTTAINTLLDNQAVRAAFNQAADSYAEAAAMQWEVGQRLLDRLALIHLKPLRILELGCSCGRFAQQLAMRFPKAEVIGLDFAEKMLQKGLKNNKLQQAVCADMHQLPFANNQFDLIFSNLTLQWSEQYEVLFTELYRVLANQGVLLFSTLGPDTLKELRLAWSATDEAPHVHLFTDMHLLGDALLQAKCIDPVVDAETITFLYASVKQLLQDLQRTGTQNRLQDRRQSLTGKNRLQKMIRAYENTFQQDNKIPASYEIIYGHAWKVPNNAKSKKNNEEFTISLEQLRKSLSDAK